jgi:hypothetical protein
MFSLIHPLFCRRIDERDVNYTAKPGIVGGFGAIVNRIGRGFPRMVACGKEFTIVSIYLFLSIQYHIII